LPLPLAECGTVMPDGASEREIAEEAIRRRAAQKPSELEALIGLMRQRQPRTVVEIGTAHGGTLFALCQAAAVRATVVSIDLPGGLFGGGYSKDEARRFKAFARPGQRLWTLRRDSKSPWTLRRLRWLLRGRSIEFLMIDGDHTYEAVRRDWELYEPLVSNDGLIAFHDIVEHPHLPSCQVDQLWREIAPQHKTLEFIDPDDDEWGGIGVIFKDCD
jgi:cephalosporin hydroxylase